MMVIYHRWQIGALCFWLLSSGCDQGSGLSDALGSSCEDSGICLDGQVCRNGACVPMATDIADGQSGDDCKPNCEGRQCGNDGCGGVCGLCPDGTHCNATFQCEANDCTRHCNGRDCGPDGCGGICGTCPVGTFCNAGFLCETGVCEPSCAGKQCGSDGCSGQCGTCPDGTFCNASLQCEAGVCEPNCTGKQCGPDGCGQFCGTCPTGQTCMNGQCAVGTCGQAAPIIDGTLNTEEAEISFDRVTVTVAHKQDIDPWEDGCLVSIALDFAKGYGCALHVVAGGATTSTGGLRVTDLSFSADSQCPGFADEMEGVYDGPDGLVTAEILSGIMNVPDENAPQSCLTTIIELHLAGVLRAESQDRLLSINETRISISGEFLSQGSTTAACPCQADCNERECGADGCGGSCGSCPADQICDADVGRCLCVPDCGLRECGADGCGGSCGQCSGTDTCQSGQCRPCQPNCAGKDCGDDGCGGSCGSCPAHDECNSAHQCECAPACDGRECGDDGCDGSCGSCPSAKYCVAGQCTSCQPDCSGRQCGSDGCGGDCGTCTAGNLCNPTGQCVASGSTCSSTTIIECDDTISADNTGGSTGINAYSCEPTWQETGPARIYRFVPEVDDLIEVTLEQQTADVDLFVLEGVCNANACLISGDSGASFAVTAGQTYFLAVDGYNQAHGPFALTLRCQSTCVPDCAGKECGDDGCGDICGMCAADEMCNSGECIACTANCIGKICGDNGCGGSCGQCPESTSCSTDGTQCVDSCLGIPTAGCCQDSGTLGPTLYNCNGPLGPVPTPCLLMGALSCGWDPDTAQYACGFTEEDPSGQNPRDCPPDIGGM